MKHISLSVVTFGLISAAVAVTMWKKAHTDGKIALEAAKVVERAVEYRDSVKQDTVWFYKTRYVYVQADRQVPDAPFTDTAVLSLPSDMGQVHSTMFRDTLSKINLTDYIKPPKSFVFRDSNIYLAGTIVATGVNIDSLSVPAKLSFDPVWKKNVAEIGIVSANPYINGLSPVTLYAKKRLCFPCFGK